MPTHLTSSPRTSTLKRALIAAAAALLVSATAGAQSPAPEQTGERGPGVPAFWVRPGFKVTVAAEQLGEARFMEYGPHGELFLSSPNSGRLTVLSDPDADGKFQTRARVLEGYPKIHGLCFADDGYLYFTTTGAIYRIKPPAPTADAKWDKSQIQVVLADGTLPRDGGHWWRSIVVKEGKLWTSIGDGGNISDQTDSERQKIWQFTIDPDTGAASDKKLWSTGIRNTEKLRFRPTVSGEPGLTGSLYGADHGSDNLGKNYGEKNGGPITDAFPPCEFNRYAEGFNYGHPFVTGLGLPRPEYAQRPDILQLVENNTPPVWCFGAHWAPNGWSFLAKDTLGMRGDALVALHGSWNSRQKVGYRIEHLCFDPATNAVYGAMPLVITLAPNGKDFFGRPVDVTEAPDGSVLFSDDNQNRIYRITRVK